MLTNREKNLLELYKELGHEVRQLNMETYATNRLMLPALVIGLLVLYGEVKQFLGVNIENVEAVYVLVWVGCLVISFIWIINMSRVAQLGRWHRQTAHACESELELIGHRRIVALDAVFVHQWLRHSNLRFFGFGIYLFLLLASFPLREIIRCYVYNVDCRICYYVISLLAGVVSCIIPTAIHWYYVKRPQDAKLKRCPYCKELTAELVGKTVVKCSHCRRHGGYDLLDYR